MSLKLIANIVSFEWECYDCGAVIKTDTNISPTNISPAECFEEEGGCGRKSDFRLIGVRIDEKIKFIDFRKKLMNNFVQNEIDNIIKRAKKEGWMKDGEKVSFDKIMAFGFGEKYVEPLAGKRSASHGGAETVVIGGIRATQSNQDG